MSTHTRRVALPAAWIVLGMSMGAGLSQTPPRLPEDASQNECVRAAFDEYKKRNVAILEQKLNNGPRATMEFTLQQRRIQEQFCLRFAKCLFPDWNNSTTALQASVAFEACLRNEASNPDESE